MPWLRLAPSIVEAVETSARGGIPHDDPAVIVAEEPIGGGGDPVAPLLVAVNGPGAGTRIGECRHLNGLLVESRTVVVGTAVLRRG